MEFELANAKDLIRTMFRMQGSSSFGLGAHATELAATMRREYEQE